ncbi:MAG TPA: hypothetical protein DEH10_04085 [Pseudomonas sp.]|nr:hypothetical protein [Pseudomonas sp.]
MNYWPCSRWLTRQRLACWRSRMRVWVAFMASTVTSEVKAGKYLKKNGDKARYGQIRAILLRENLCGCVSIAR